MVTGLAGTLTSTSLTSKERKFAATHLKDTKSDVLKSIRNLSEAQLAFKPAPDKWSIKECIYHVAVSEKNLWHILDGAMKQPPNSEKRSEIKLVDEQVETMVEDRTKKIIMTAMLEPKNSAFTTIDEALESFKKQRMDHIKYMKTTTKDLRNHVTELPIGWVDCYQLCLFISAHTNRHIQQIEEIKGDPSFPKQ